MNIYVETNFVLELVFQQEQSASCEQILQLCESQQSSLIIPAYSLAEPHEKLFRQARNRKDLQRSLEGELRQLARSSSFTERITSIQDIARLLLQSNEDEKLRLNQYQNRLLQIADIIPLTSFILSEAATYEKTYNLTPQDALVYPSVVNHLRQSQPSLACFLNRNSRDFDNPDIVDQLNGYHCRMITRFDHGYHYINTQVAH